MLSSFKNDMSIVRELLHTLSINRNIYCMHLPLCEYVSGWHSQCIGIPLLVWLKKHFCQSTKLRSRWLLLRASMVKFLALVPKKFIQCRRTHDMSDRLWSWASLRYTPSVQFASSHTESPWLHLCSIAKALDGFWFQLVCFLIHFTASCIAIMCITHSYLEHCYQINGTAVISLAGLLRMYYLHLMTYQRNCYLYICVKCFELSDRKQLKLN